MPGLMDGLGEYRSDAARRRGVSLDPREPAPEERAGLIDALSVVAPFMGPLARGGAAMRSVIMPTGRAASVPVSAADDVALAAVNNVTHRLSQVPGRPPVPSYPQAPIPQIRQPLPYGRYEGTAPRPIHADPNASTDELLRYLTGRR